MNTISKISRRSLLAAATAATWPLHAQPSRTAGSDSDSVIRVVTSFLSGAGTDALLRLALNHVSDSTGKRFIVDNKPGADGMIAANDVLRSPADGNTLLVVANTTIPGVAALKKNPPYDPNTAFVGISLLGFYTVYLFASKEVPFDTVAGLVKYGRAHPKELSIGEAGFTHRITAVKLSQIGGVQLTEVPYKGEPALVSDIISNRIQLAFASPAVLMPFVKEGKLKVFATVMPRRTKAEPKIPTMTEEGLLGFDGAGWSGIFGAKGFPQDLREKLSEAFVSAFLKPNVVALAEQIGFSIKTSAPSETDRFVAKEITSTVAAVRRAGIPLE